MTPEIEKYYNAYFDLFITTGWEQFVQEAKDAREGITLDGCKDWDTFLVMKTRREQLNQIIEFENLIKASYDRLNTPEEDDTYNDSL